MDVIATDSALDINSNCDLTTQQYNSADTTATDLSQDIGKNTSHIPYILNGELYEIQTQEGENVTVRCCHCPPDRVYRGSVRSTGNFHMHIKRRHPDLLGKLHDMKVNALIERRDRLIRNRKLPYRSCRVSTTNRFKQEASLEQDVAPALHSMHKLKIKSAYQRHQIQHQQQQQQLQYHHHQQQQQQQNQQHHHKQFEETHEWNLTPFVVVPIDDTCEVYEPINYCIKSNNQAMVNINDSLIPPIRDEKEEKKLQQPLPVQDQATQVSQQPLMKCGSGPESPSECFLFSGNATHFDSVSNFTSCPSTSSSFDSNISCVRNVYNSISVIKDELLMAEKAIDLTANSTSLSLTSGLGTSAKTSTAERKSLESHSASGSLAPNMKWNDLLQQVELSLREIQREMHTRNEIETNRLFLDVAKFKYLNPGFHFQC